MIGGPTRLLGFDPAEPQFAQIQLIDEHVDHPGRILLADPVLQALREQRRLAAIQTLYKPPHPILPDACRRIVTRNAFSHMA